MNTIKTKLLAALTLGLALGSAQAGPIAILNHSFEDPVVDTVWITDVTDWQDIGAAGDNGVFLGGGTYGQDALPTAGSQIAFLNDVETCALVQTLATNYQAGLDYSLTVDIAARTPVIAADGATLVLYTGSITVVSDLAASNIVATLFVGGTNGLTEDAFNTVTLTATAAQVAAVSGAGQAIGIGIVGGVIGAPVSNRSQNYDLDNVRLDSAVGVPLVLKISQSGGNLDFEWNSKSGKQYDLVSSTDLATNLLTWLPYNDGGTTYENIPASGTGTNTLSGVLKVGAVRFFSLIQKP